MATHLLCGGGNTIVSSQDYYIFFCSFLTYNVESVNFATQKSVNFFQEERLQHANLRPSGLRPLFLYTLLVFRWLLQCPIRTSSTVTATSQALTNLLRSYRTATRHHSSLPIRYTNPTLLLDFLSS